MKPFYIKATPDSPEIDFNFASHTLRIAGEAYPENAAQFFHPVKQELKDYLAVTSKCKIAVNFHLTYFNSASTKMLYGIFELLNESARCSANDITINWHHDEEDDAIMDFCHEIKHDFNWLVFKIVSTNAAD